MSQATWDDAKGQWDEAQVLREALGHVERVMKLIERDRHQPRRIMAHAEELRAICAKALRG